ncbi:nuclear transport factor 2 family protein [Nakamurella leprariae]|uniref:Nuclear transport factor 2 family protein n=1 Tax=Nakamurella leprariae TaxID=2803911 RepID=A0A938Y8K8_9ACTN|nr:nuclear transport factor 2 family protein [Nakamurella leprariae]MBM9467835.1 nuclear transport factor 2 family protein [Nakamurella leprariae]
MITAAQDEAVIRELEDRRYDAMVAGDFVTFRELCHPDLRYTHSTAITDTVESYLEKCTTGFYDYHWIEHPIAAITVVGDTALVFGDMRADLTAGGVRKQLDNVSLAVWARLDGDWKLLAYQPTVRPAA